MQNDAWRQHDKMQHDNQLAKREVTEVDKRQRCTVRLRRRCVVRRRWRVKRTRGGRSATTGVTQQPAPVEHEENGGGASADRGQDERRRMRCRQTM
jgi:hypothetical protein